MAIEPFTGQVTRNDHFVQKMIFLKELKVQIWTYELRSHG